MKNQGFRASRKKSFKVLDDFHPTRKVMGHKHGIVKGWGDLGKERQK